MIQEAMALLDGVAPGLHGVVAALVAATIIASPTLLWLAKLRFDWRRDQREARDSMAAMMNRLVDQQRAELVRLVSEGDALRRQIDLFIDGRWQLQRALDDMREQMIAALSSTHALAGSYPQGGITPL